MRTNLFWLASAALLVAAWQGQAVAETWDGDAAPADANWSTDANWAGDAKPSDPTANEIVFTDAGIDAETRVGNSLLDPDGDEWTVGALTVRNASGTHAIDLNGKTLLVTGSLLVSPTDNRPGRNAAVTFTNGEVFVGAPETESDAIIGETTTKGAGGRLSLDGATLAVTNRATVGAKGKVHANINGFSGGLDLAGGSTLTVPDGGLISITFAADEDEGTAGPYWGLRWKGNHLAELGKLKTQWRLTFTVAEGVKGIANIWYDDAADYTYVSVKEKWPPTVLTRDLTVELPPGGTVKVHANDIDAGSYHAGQE